MKEYYKITEVARLYGLCTDTLRYYEEQGLLHPHRSEAGYRLYSIDDICNLNVIRALRELDMPVEHMRPLFRGTYSGLHTGHAGRAGRCHPGAHCRPAGRACRRGCAPGAFGAV